VRREINEYFLPQVVVIAVTSKTTVMSGFGISILHF
jgi:hypothetical protein